MMETDSEQMGMSPDQNDVPPSGPVDVTDADIDGVEALLNEVERAMTAIDAGDYGCCDMCGESIDDARLAEQPSTRTCSACSA